MKQFKKNKFIVISVCLILIVFVVLGVIIFSSKKEHYVPEEEITNIEEDMLGDITIDTPYISLFFPAKWEEYMHIEVLEGDNYCMTFYCSFSDEKGDKIFDVIFGSNITNSIGMIQSHSGEIIEMGIQVYEFDDHNKWSDFEKMTYYEMQDDLNYMLSKLKIVNSTEEFNTEEVIIETPYGNLFYPGRREDKLRVEITEGEFYAIGFYGMASGGKECHLFDIILGVNLENYIGEISLKCEKKVYVNVKIYEILDNVGWTDAEKILFYEMQDDLNYLLDKLMNNE